MEIRKPARPSVITPPRWKPFAVAAILCLLFFDFWKRTAANPQSVGSVIEAVIEVLLIVGTLIGSGVHYRFTEDYMVVCFLWVPLRRIRWQRVTHALFAHAWADPQTKYQRITSPGVVTGQIIYVTIDRCLRWYPVLTTRWLHNLIHPFRAFTIWLPYNRKAFFVDAFQKHYPDLEMQPLDAWERFS